MAVLEPIPIFENISQRVVNSYIKQLSEFSPVISDMNSADLLDGIRNSQTALHNFYLRFYQQAFDHPEYFGLPIKEDACMVPGNSKEEKRIITSKFKKPRDTMAYGIDFLVLAGNQGQLVNGNLHLAVQQFSAFFAKNPRVKRKVLTGMESAGLIVDEQDDRVIVKNTQFPEMMPALKSLAQACEKISDTRIGRFLFSRCDFRALDTEYQPDVLDMLHPILPPESKEDILGLHQYLSEYDYEPALNMGGISEWRIQYQGNRKIKATPFFEIEYDERLQNQFVMRVKCASTNRLVPLLNDQPVTLQKDFFTYSNKCGGVSCGWCKTRKGMGPSVIQFDGAKKTICWYMQRYFYTVDSMAVKLIQQYTALHEGLLTA